MRRTPFQRLVSWLVERAYGEELRACYGRLTEGVGDKNGTPYQRRVYLQRRAGALAACLVVGVNVHKRGGR